MRFGDLLLLRLLNLPLDLFVLIAFFCLLGIAPAADIDGLPRRRSKESPSAEQVLPFFFFVFFFPKLMTCFLRMSPVLAMDWLLEAEGDEEILSTPLTAEEIEKIKKRKNTFKANPVV